MKNLFRKALLAMIVLAALPNGVASADGETRCQRDHQFYGPLGAARSHWVNVCAQAQLRYLWEEKMGNAKGMAYSKIVEETIDKWSLTPSGELRERPFYPTFGTEGKNDVWKAPRHTLAGCMAGDPTGYQIQGLCRAHPPQINTSFFTKDGLVKLSDIPSGGEISPLVVSHVSATDRLEFEEGPKIKVTPSQDDYQIDTFELVFQSGARTLVTQSHTFIDAARNRVAAKAVRLGQELIAQDGKLDKVVAITDGKYVGKLYTLTPAAASHHGWLSAEQGFLSASFWAEKDDIDYVNDRIYRGSSPKDLLHD